MSVRRSTENLALTPPAQTNPSQAPPSVSFDVCGVCKNSISNKGNSTKTICNHIFHKTCLSKSTQNKSSCPTCNNQITLPKFHKSNTAPTITMMTRNQSRQQNVDVNRSVNESTSRNVPTTPNTTQSSDSSPDGQRHLIRNLVAAAVGAQQAEMLASLNEQLTQLIQNNIEAGFRRLSLGNINTMPHVEISNNQGNNTENPQCQAQTLDELLGIPTSVNINNEGDVRFQANPSSNMLRFNSGFSTDLAIRPDKISQIISNWKLKFSGNTAGLSVDSFLYRIEALTKQTLGGNFDLLCCNASVLFEGKASDWFWRYHKSVKEIKWPDLCLSLRQQFKDTRTDMDYRELIRDRKQKPGENFDAFYDSILELVDHLDQPIAEMSMIEILRRNLLPEIQHEILNLQIFSVAHLRDVCRKREFFLQDIRKRNIGHRPLGFPKKVSELFDEACEELEIGHSVDISELGLICWNCRKTGHRYQECLAERNVFCYGCGSANVYKPTCSKCNPSKNFSSSAQPSARRQTLMKKIDRATSTD